MNQTLTALLLGFLLGLGFLSILHFAKAADTQAVAAPTGGMSLLNGGSVLVTPSGEFVGCPDTLSRAGSEVNGHG